MRFRTPIPAALAALLAAIPVGAVLASEREAPPRPLVSPDLRVSLGGDAGAGEAMRDHVRAGLEREHVRLAVRYARVSGRPAAGAARRARRLSPRQLRAANRELRAEVRELDVPVPAVLHRVAECESGGDPRAIGGGGAFRGALQFMQSTWESVGGEGDPAAAPMEEQLRRGAILMSRSGSSPWPVCGA